MPRPDQRSPAALVAAVTWLLGVAGLAQMSADCDCDRLRHNQPIGRALPT